MKTKSEVKCVPGKLIEILAVEITVHESSGLICVKWKNPGASIRLVIVTPLLMNVSILSCPANSAVVATMWAHRSY